MSSKAKIPTWVWKAKLATDSSLSCIWSTASHSPSPFWPPHKIPILLSHLFQPQLYAQSSVLFSFLPYLSTSTSPFRSSRKNLLSIKWSMSWSIPLLSFPTQLGIKLNRTPTWPQVWSKSNWIRTEESREKFRCQPHLILKVIEETGVMIINRFSSVDIIGKLQNWRKQKRSKAKNILFWCVEDWTISCWSILCHSRFEPLLQCVPHQFCLIWYRLCSSSLAFSTVIFFFAEIEVMEMHSSFNQQ